ncbi:MAG TPA: hypothetical protein PLL10_11360 [Elusimicrobiales bacterium]|nr:hypothetical protein [Elusimicrobiales bacterium]
MKFLTVLLLAGLPAGAWAMGGCGMGPGMGYGMRHGMGGGCGHGAVALYALIGALGYLVLQHAAKQEKKCVAYGGRIFGMLIMIIGLLGVLCGVVSHAKSAMGCGSRCKVEAVEVTEGGPMEQRIEKTIIKGANGDPKQVQVNVKVTEAKKAK